MQLRRLEVPTQPASLGATLLRVAVPMKKV
jgi:hypothetical protein